VLLEVADTGEGIPQEAQEQVFNPFFSTKTYGTGLGLAICKKIVDDHAGILVIQGAPDQGTTVRIYLPSKISYQEGLYDENPVDC
jgi:two-component system nitrogen regulation sensor histidine kinase GlnL